MFLQNFKMSYSLSNRLIVSLMKQLDFLFDDRDSKLDKINLLFQKIAELLLKRNEFRCFIESQSISLSNSLEFWDIVVQQKFDKIDSMNVVLINHRSHVKNNLTCSNKDVQLLRVIFFVHFWLDNVQISLLSHD